MIVVFLVIIILNIISLTTFKVQVDEDKLLQFFFFFNFYIAQHYVLLIVDTQKIVVN